MENKKEKFTLYGHTYWVRDLEFSPDQQFLASVSEDSSLRIWDLKTQKEVFNLTDNETRIWGVTYTWDGKFIITACYDKIIRIWDIQKCAIECRLSEHTDQVIKVVISPDKIHFASASYDKTIKIWNFNERKCVGTLHGHMNWIRNLIYFNNGDNIISVSDDKTIRIWNVQKQTEEFRLEGHTNSIYAISGHPNGKYFATGSGDKLLKIWNFEERREEFSLPGHAQAVRKVKYSPCGKYIVSCCMDGNIKVWNLDERREDYTINAHSDTVPTVIYSPQGDYIISGSADTTIKVWQVNAIKSEKILSRKSLSMIDPGFQPFIPFYSIFSNIKWKSFDQIGIESIGLLISHYELTVIHFFAYLGLANLIEKFYQQEGFILKADIFGHSPLFYSILMQHQECTDILLQYLIDSSTQETKTLSIMTSFYAIRNDFLLIIENSSSLLDQFLNTLIIANTNTPYFGIPHENLPYAIYTDSAAPLFTNFLTVPKKNSNQEDKAQPIIIKTSIYPLPSAPGSIKSIEYLNTILECSNEEIFRTKLIQHFIRKRWIELKYWICFFTFLVWANLILIICNLSSEIFWPVFTPLTF